MSSKWEVYKNIRALGISEDRTNKIKEIVESGYISNDECESRVRKAKEEAEETMEQWKEEKEKYDKLLNDPCAFLERLVGDIVCKHLKLQSGDDPYSRDVELSWDKDYLGSVTIQHFSED